ncbi:MULTISPECIES: hypothetical protein [unclassified Brevibacterium]|uniref:hypothetical protein n=1 Tax=unclassified Brevibacterium TaxID=2614124 RepID=UPI003211F052
MTAAGAFDEEGLRELVPAVIGILRGRGADFPAAEERCFKHCPHGRTILPATGAGGL